MVPAWYFRPKAARGNLVVELDIHGGPEEQDRAWLYPWAQYLTSRGYALLDPNIRGSSGYGRTYLHMADGRERENAVGEGFEAGLAHGGGSRESRGGLRIARARPAISQVNLADQSR